MTTLRVVFWNVKSPSLTPRGVHSWVKRRTRLKASIAGSKANIVSLSETGSGVYLTWWKRAMKTTAKLRWAKGGRYWQNFFNSSDVRFVAGGQKHQPMKDRLNKDDKPMAWEVVNYLGQRWLIGCIHPENEGGNSAQAVALRKRQVFNAVGWLRDDLGPHYGVPNTRQILTGDFNDPTGAIIRAIHRNTTFRDAFTIAKHTQNKALVSNSKWQSKPFKGRRIDFILVHKSVNVAQAINSWANGRSDHNKQTVDIEIAA